MEAVGWVHAASICVCYVRWGASRWSSLYLGCPRVGLLALPCDVELLCMYTQIDVHKGVIG